MRRRPAVRQRRLGGAALHGPHGQVEALLYRHGRAPDLAGGQRHLDRLVHERTAEADVHGRGQGVDDAVGGPDGGDDDAVHALDAP